MAKQLKTLEEHNRQNMSKNRYSAREDYLNGVACPNCGKELYTVYGVMLTSDPPQKKIYCKEEGCGYVGSMY